MQLCNTLSQVDAFCHKMYIYQIVMILMTIVGCFVGCRKSMQSQMIVDIVDHDEMVATVPADEFHDLPTVVQATICNLVLD